MDFPDESGKPPFAKLEFLPGRKHGKTCSGRCLFSRFRGITDEQTRKDGIYTILALAELGADSLLGIRPASLAGIARFVTLTLGWALRPGELSLRPYLVNQAPLGSKPVANHVRLNSASWPVLVCCGKTHFGPRRKAGLLSLAGRWFAASKCSALNDRGITWIAGYGLSRIMPVLSVVVGCASDGRSGLLSGSACCGARCLVSFSPAPPS